MNKTVEALHGDEGAVRWYWWVLIALAVVALFAVLALRSIDRTILVGRIETVSGNTATVFVDELDRSLEVETIDPDLPPGTVVIVQVQGDEATLEATSPTWVGMWQALKGLAP